MFVGTLSILVGWQWWTSNLGTLQPGRIYRSAQMGPSRLTETMDFADGRAAAGYRHPLLLMLDEFPTLGRMDVLQTALAPGGLPVMGDRIQLQQVLLNLLLKCRRGHAGGPAGAAQDGCPRHHRPP